MGSANICIFFVRIGLAFVIIYGFMDEISAYDVI